MAMLFSLAAMWGTPPAQAGDISTPSLTGIFSQASFGTLPIAVRWLAPGATIVNPALAIIDSDEEITALYAAAPIEFPVLSVFFVDAVNFCGSAGVFTGCAQIRGYDSLVASAFASAASGDVHIARGIGHNLGLVEDSTVGNLMHPFPAAGATTLTQAQADTILQNQGYLLQIAADGSIFIELRPIAVVASVPEPAAWLLFGCGLTVLGAFARRRRVH